MRDAILILGPSGSGKTPLGAALEAGGLRGRACRHFDFGAELRAAAAGRPRGLDGVALRTVREVLASGRLLEDREAGIARALLGDFLRGEAERDALVVLNGLPRHVGQARDVADLVRVVRVVELVAGADEVLARVRLHAAGERAGRQEDDRPESLAARRRAYETRTRPLLDHYRAQGTAVGSVAVGAGTPAEAVRVAIEASFGA